MGKNQFLKVKNSLLQLQKDFTKLKQRELKDREVKIIFQTRVLFKPIIVFIVDMNKIEQKEMKKIGPIKNTWYDWLINYIPDPIRRSVGGLKDKIASLLKTNTPKQAGRGSMGEERSKNNLKKTLLIVFEIFLY